MAARSGPCGPEIGASPHVVVFPGAAIVLLVLGINLFQDGLRMALDPKMAEH